jgi:hypothetical protein
MRRSERKRRSRKALPSAREMAVPAVIVIYSFVEQSDDDKRMR